MYIATSRYISLHIKTIKLGGGEMDARLTSNTIHSGYRVMQSRIHKDKHTYTWSLTHSLPILRKGALSMR